LVELGVAAAGVIGSADVKDGLKRAGELEPGDAERLAEVVGELAALIASGRG
jgi:hypothetical protein